ncbi:hypothetical protein F7725_028735 [Dissostichus mawsoni]|uniref:Uncharacterized protein n=1 Tax=Dissostichus mawsoni TaxID=36200 RepID=A0A7J5XHU6_DISMA|nr:hypothetical protein F7725_028735 [Dissostichus mawsoni]
MEGGTQREEGPSCWEMKRHLLYYHQNPATVSTTDVSPLTSRSEPGGGEGSPSPFLLNSITTFNQNHKQSREELCLVMNTVKPD